LFEETYYPDFFAERDGFPFILAEVKKPSADPATLDDDAKKLPCMMKVAMDRMWSASVENPVVVGLLIQGKMQCVFVVSSNTLLSSIIKRSNLLLLL
jgi:hypothetical protein